MKPVHIILSVAATSLLASCFKDEPRNAECDITRAALPVAHPEDYFNPTTLRDTTVDASGGLHVTERTAYTDSVVTPNADLASPDITFNYKRGADISALAPTFTLTPGATMAPASGSVHDFSGGPVAYTVTSESGEWQRTYQVSLRPYPEYALKYSFENYALEPSRKKYYEWLEVGDDGATSRLWATGNPGFALARGTAKAQDYPTIPLEEGLSGHGVQLTTRATGSLGAMSGMRLAAGNLFLGSFDSSNALKDALTSTHFGVPFNVKPLKFSGHYKYQPGETFQLKNGDTDEGRTDEATIYAVFYKNHDAEGNAVTLNGSNVQSSPLLVAKAILPAVPPADEWTRFEVEFKYSEDIDPELLANYGYSLAIVCSSSINGAYFEGAVGSTLCIDELELTCKDQDETTEP